jgi:hypothetical protein
MNTGDVNCLLAFADICTPDPFYVGAQSHKGIHETGVAAINVVHLVNRGEALRYQPGEYQPCTRTNIGSFNRGSAEFLPAPHKSVVAFRLHICTESGQLMDKSKACLKQVLCYEGCSFRNSSSAQ